MFLNAIAKPIQNLYSEIPGNTHSDKAAYVGKKALWVIPLAASGYFLSGRMSSQTAIWCMSMVPIFGIGVMFRDGIIAAKKISPTASRTHNWMYFCMAYSAAYYAAINFRFLFPKKARDQEPPAIAPSFYSRAFDVLLKGAFLPIPFLYRPKTTLAGIGLGVCVVKYSEGLKNWIFTTVNSTADLLIASGFKRDNVDAVRVPYLKNVQEDYNKLNTLPSQASRIAKIWKEWNYMACSVASPSAAVIKSIEQGRLLFLLFGYGKTPPPTETPPPAVKEKED